jgi:hypothetical protein
MTISRDVKRMSIRPYVTAFNPLSFNLVFKTIKIEITYISPRVKSPQSFPQSLDHVVGWKSESFPSRRLLLKWNLSSTQKPFDIEV